MVKLNLYIRVGHRGMTLEPTGACSRVHGIPEFGTCPPTHSDPCQNCQHSYIFLHKHILEIYALFCSEHAIYKRYDHCQEIKGGGVKAPTQYTNKQTVTPYREISLFVVCRVLNVKLSNENKFCIIIIITEQYHAEQCVKNILSNKMQVIQTHNSFNRLNDTNYTTLCVSFPVSFTGMYFDKL